MDDSNRRILFMTTLLSGDRLTLIADSADQLWIEKNEQQVEGCCWNTVRIPIAIEILKRMSRAAMVP